MLQGIFKVTSTIGLPLNIILIKCKEENYVIDWINYYKDALGSGMSSDRILSRIDSEIVDIYGSEYRDEIKKRLLFFIKNNEARDTKSQ